MISRGKAASACGWFVLGLLVIGLRSPAVQPFQPTYGDPLHESWRWRTFMDLSGLDTQAVTEGADGTMWFGTSNGVWSYDGIEWRQYGVDENLGRLVTTLCSHPDGTVYAGGAWGISQYSQGQWVRLLSTSTSGARIADLRQIPIRKLAVTPQGELWAATAWGVLRRRDSLWTLYTDTDTAQRLGADENLASLTFEHLPESVVAKLSHNSSRADPCDFNEVCADEQGRIWFGTVSGEVLCYAAAPATALAAASQGTWSIYNEADGLTAGVVTSILAAQDGTIWVVHAASEEVQVFDRQTWRTVRLPLFLPDLDLADDGGKLLQTRDGVIWLSARFQLFAYRDGQWQVYGLPDIEYPSMRNVVMQSADGALWFSGANSEIHRVDYQTTRWLTLLDLIFQWESAAGAQWFLHRDGRIVVHDANQWTSYGVEDGLMDMPVALLGTRSGEVWAAGSHEHTAAMARFDGQKWTLFRHENFSFGLDWRAAFESSDGSLWFGAHVDTDGPDQHRNGLLQYRDGAWIHHHQPGRSPRPDGAEHPATLLPPSTDPDHPIEKFFCLGESPDGRIWAGRDILAVYDGNKWEEHLPRANMRRGTIESALTTREGTFWLGTRASGALRYDGQVWQQFHGKESLGANSVRSLAQTADGSIWAVTDRGISRFDGRAWMARVLPEVLNIAHESGDLKASPSGHLWINRYTLYWMRRAWAKSPPPDPTAEFRTVRFEFRGEPPRTSILTTVKTIAQPGNLAVLWTGEVPWREPEAAPLQFSHRLDDAPWSAFTSERGHSFFSLPPGRHRLEVRARDGDFNVDPTPAALEFEVLPPVWRQLWFIALVGLLSGLVVAQSIRVVREQGRLRKARDELEVRVRHRTAELESANRELEAFSYSVSHDLRSPLRSIDGFSQILQEDCADRLTDEEKGHLQTVRAAAQRMGSLIDDMLMLGQVTRGELRRTQVNLSKLASDILAELARREPERNVRLTVAPEVMAQGDANLLMIALENLLGNAWKFTSKREEATIEFGVTEQAGERVYFIRDNGAGFDMTYANKLFAAFQRLHRANDFAGSGVGLAIVQRVIQRHGGRVWAEAQVDHGATFFFTLENQAGP